MSLLDNIRKMITPISDEDDDYDEVFGEQESPFFDERPRYDRSAVDSRRGKVVNIHATTQLKVVLVKPERFENASEIADHLKEKRTVVVNLEGCARQAGAVRKRQRNCRPSEGKTYGCR